MKQKLLGREVILEAVKESAPEHTTLKLSITIEEK